MRGTVAKVVSVKSGLKISMRMRTPRMVMIPEINCVMLEFSVAETLSTSLVRRLINSPWVC